MPQLPRELRIMYRELRWLTSRILPVEPFWAVPNFRFFEGCGRPCWQPLYAQPVITKGEAVTDGWPCEYYDRASADKGPYCTERDDPNGDRLLVIGQVRGERLQDDRLVISNLWYQVVVPRERVKPRWRGRLDPVTVPRERIKPPKGRPFTDLFGFEAFGSALWLVDGQLATAMAAERRRHKEDDEPDRS
jgi:hypothetical protein